MFTLTKRRNSSQVGQCLHVPRLLMKAFERALKIAPNAVAQATAFTFAAYQAVTVFQRLFVGTSGFAFPPHACGGRPPTHHKLDILPAVTREATTTHCRVAPAQPNPRGGGEILLNKALKGAAHGRRRADPLRGGKVAL